MLGPDFGVSCDSIKTVFTYIYYGGAKRLANKTDLNAEEILDEPFVLVSSVC